MTDKETINVVSKFITAKLTNMTIKVISLEDLNFNIFYA